MFSVSLHKMLGLYPRHLNVAPPWSLDRSLLVHTHSHMIRSGDTRTSRTAFRLHSAFRIGSNTCHLHTGPASRRSRIFRSLEIPPFSRYDGHEISVYPAQLSTIKSADIPDQLFRRWLALFSLIPIRNWFPCFANEIAKAILRRMPISSRVTRNPERRRGKLQNKVIHHRLFHSVISLLVSRAVVADEMRLPEFVSNNPEHPQTPCANCRVHAGTLAMSRAYVRRLPTMASTKDASRSRLWRFTLPSLSLKVNSSMYRERCLGLA